jgi:predicted RNA-binding Zn ribbon-like protein
VNPEFVNPEFPFPLLGEPISLDLVNTRIRTGAAAADLLDEPQALGAWLAAESGRVQWSGTVDAADLLAVRALRDAIARLLTARRAHTRPSPEALRALNAVLLASATATGLTWTEHGPLATTCPARSQRDALLYAIAMDAVTLLTSHDAELLRTCAHPDCTLQFIARNPRRRWCSATTCGNRARVARHYVRHHGNT